MIFMGVVAYGSSVLAYTYAFNFTSIANIYFILSTYPVFAAFIAVPVLSEKIIRKDILALFILTIGLIIIFNPTDLYRDLTGNVLAMYVAITFALYVIISRYLSSKNESAETITFLSIGVGALATTVPALLFESIPHTISSASIVGVLIFGLLNFIAHILVNIGFKTIKASTGTMVLMLEAVMGTVLAMLFFAEMPTLMFMSGAFLILAAVYISVKS